MKPGPQFGMHLPCDGPIGTEPPGAGLGPGLGAGQFPLGFIRFGVLPQSHTVMEDSVPCLPVPLPVLGVSQADSTDFVAQTGTWCEGLLAQSATRTGVMGDVHYCQDDELLFGVLSMPEGPGGEPAATAAGGTHPLQTTTRAAYQQIFSLMDRLGYTYVWRYWNYMADINAEEGGLERYRQFNFGRQEAFEQSGRDQADHATAACALGYAPVIDPQKSPLCIAFLAAKSPSMALENPRQIRAIDYPPQYGPRSPIFSRGSLARLGARSLLFVSGTASIVGHESVHLGDVEAQTRETLVNITQILAAANQQDDSALPSMAFTLADLSYRVYVRHAADAPRIHAAMVHLIGGPVTALFLQADICRQELLVEIEISPASTPYR